MFTVCKAVNLIDVRAGIARSFAKDKQEKYVLLSAPILAKLLEMTGDYTVSNEVVTAKSPADIEILHENEALLLAKYIVDSGEPVVREGEMEPLSSAIKQTMISPRPISLVSLSRLI